MVVRSNCSAFAPVRDEEAALVDDQRGRGFGLLQQFLQNSILSR